MEHLAHRRYISLHMMTRRKLSSSSSIYQTRE